MAAWREPGQRRPLQRRDFVPLAIVAVVCIVVVVFNVHI